VKKIFILLAVIGFGLVFLQQRSYAVNNKTNHTDYKNMEIKECNACHKSEGVAPYHDSNWLSEHRILAGKAGNNCNQCHEQSWCLDCHQGGLLNGTNLEKENFGRDSHPKSHRSDFISIHPIQAQNNQQQCNRCHDKTYCNACHSRFPKGSLRIKSHNPLGSASQQYTANNWRSEHTTEARRNLQSCQTCHPEGDVCIQCHSSGKVRPHPRNWKSGNMKDRSNGKVCQKCHLPGTY
jgi:hypothetical protein